MFVYLYGEFFIELILENRVERKIILCFCLILNFKINIWIGILGC